MELHGLALRIASVLQRRGLLCTKDDPCSVSFTRNAHRPIHKKGSNGNASMLPSAELRVCPSRSMRRVFCAPFANDRTTNFKASKIAAGCLAPVLRCRNFNIASIIADVMKLRQNDDFARSNVFYGPEDVDAVFARIQRKPKNYTQLFEAMSRMQVPAAQQYGRCALVGANHVLRCRDWGERFDGNSYQAILRVNGFQLDPKVVPNQWLDPRHAGSRTTFRQSCMTLGKRLESTRGEVCLLTPDFLSNQVTHTDHAQVCGGNKRRSEYTERSVAAAAAKGFRFLLFGRGGNYTSLQGTGSGDAAFVAALALCRELHVYGVGLHGRRRHDGVLEAVYQHGYDEGLAQCSPRASEINCSCSSAAHPQLHCREIEAYVVSQFVREMQWAVWHVLGLARWVWS